MNREVGSLHMRDDTENTRHTIRLHGPWQCELTSASEDTTEILTVNLPVDWNVLLRDRKISSMTWTRSFGRPTNLSDRERVELVVTCLRENVRVWLNKRELTGPRDMNGGWFDVTNRLESRNQLVLRVHGVSSEIGTAARPTEPSGASTPASFGQIRLDIRTIARQSQSRDNVS